METYHELLCKKLNLEIKLLNLKIEKTSDELNREILQARSNLKALLLKRIEGHHNSSLSHPEEAMSVSG